LSAHLLYLDFLRFLDALALKASDPWVAYQEVYLNPHRSVLEAWWRQCLGLPEQAWAERVRAIRAEDYGLLREVVQETDVAELAEEVVARCQSVVPLSPQPEVYYLVGFFSPDGFTFEVEGRWAIGIGLERFGSLRLLPIMLAHEYAHCCRRALRSPRTLGERMVDEGFAVELSRRVFPERAREDHLLMRPGQVAAAQEYEGRLWEAVEPFLDSYDEGVIARLLYGQAKKGRWASRAGVYLGWRTVSEFLAGHGPRFDAPAEEVLRERPRQG